MYARRDCRVSPRIRCSVFEGCFKLASTTISYLLLEINELLENDFVCTSYVQFTKIVSNISIFRDLNVLTSLQINRLVLSFASTTKHSHSSDHC